MLESISSVTDKPSSCCNRTEQTGQLPGHGVWLDYFNMKMGIWIITQIRVERCFIKVIGV